jgi:hypothetical protein
MQSTVRELGSKWAVAATAVMLLGLSACASDRFGGPPGAVASQPRGGVYAGGSDDMEPAPTGPAPSVISSPLPPAPGTQVAGDPNLPPPGAPAPVDPTLGQPTPGNVASLGTPSPATPPAPSRTSITGSWTAREATGGSCRMTLSSSPSLDLYRASTSGCSNRDLQSVNAWDLRDGEVYLYSRGTVVARMKGGGGAYNGVVAKSGAPFTLSR